MLRIEMTQGEARVSHTHTPLPHLIVHEHDFIHLECRLMLPSPRLGSSRFSTSLFIFQQPLVCILSSSRKTPSSNIKSCNCPRLSIRPYLLVQHCTHTNREDHRDISCPVVHVIAFFTAAIIPAFFLSPMYFRTSLSL